MEIFGSCRTAASDVRPVGDHLQSRYNRFRELLHLDRRDARLLALVEEVQKSEVSGQTWRDGWKDVWMDEWVDGWMQGRVQGWMGSRPPKPITLFMF